MQSLVVYFTHLSLVLSVRYGLITASRSLQAKGEMCTLRGPGPLFSTKMRPEPSPPPLPALSEGLDPPLNINYVLVLVYMQNCKRAHSLVCHGLS